MNVMPPTPAVISQYIETIARDYDVEIDMKEVASESLLDRKPGGDVPTPMPPMMDMPGGYPTHTPTTGAPVTFTEGPGGYMEPAAPAPAPAYPPAGTVPTPMP